MSFQLPMLNIVSQFAKEMETEGQIFFTRNGNYFCHILDENAYNEILFDANSCIVYSTLKFNGISSTAHFKLHKIHVFFESFQ